MINDIRPFVPTLTTPTVVNSAFLTKLEGYCVLFTSPSNPDLMNEYFDHNTDFGDWLSPDVNYTELEFKIHLGIHETPKIKGIHVVDGFATIGMIGYLERDLFGIRCQCILDPKIDHNFWFAINEIITKYKGFNFATRASKVEYEDVSNFPDVQRINTWHIDSVFISNTSIHAQSYTEGELKGVV